MVQSNAWTSRPLFLSLQYVLRWRPAIREAIATLILPVLHLAPHRLPDKRPLAISQYLRTVISLTPSSLSVPHAHNDNR